MSNNAFYEAYYAGTDVPKELVSGVRRSIRTRFAFADQLVPSDYLGLMDDELDLAEVARWVETEIGVKFDRSEIKELDGTFQSFVQAAWRSSNK